MTLPSSGPISLGDVNVELGRSRTAAISLGESAVRSLAGVPSGAISLGDLYGKTFATWHRASSYSITSVTGGSTSSPTAAMDGATSALDGSTYAVVAHNTTGVINSEGITYSGFGSGTFTGTLYVVCSGTCTDTRGTAVGSCSIYTNSTLQGEVDSDASGTPVTFSFDTAHPYTIGLSGVNLATLNVSVWATGGRIAPLDPDQAAATFNIYDIIAIP